MFSLEFMAGLSTTMQIAIVIGVVVLVLGLIRKAKRLIRIGVIVAILAFLVNMGIVALPL